jgi:hypothetical protein
MQNTDAPPDFLRRESGGSEQKPEALADRTEVLFEQTGLKLRDEILHQQHGMNFSRRVHGSGHLYVRTIFTFPDSVSPCCRVV